MDAALLLSAVTVNDGVLSCFPDTGFSIPVVGGFTKLPSRKEQKQVSGGVLNGNKRIIYT